MSRYRVHDAGVVEEFPTLRLLEDWLDLHQYVCENNVGLYGMDDVLDSQGEVMIYLRQDTEDDRDFAAGTITRVPE